jgi:hypothetical protein
LPQNVISLQNRQVFLVHPEYDCVRYLVVTLVTVNDTVFWAMAPCNMVEVIILEEPAASCIQKEEEVRCSRMAVNSYQTACCNVNSNCYATFQL